MRAKPRLLPVAAKSTLIAAVAVCIGAGVSPAMAQSSEGSFSALPPIESFSETIERPLFLPDRRPPAIDEEQQDVKNVESGLFTLVGIIVSPKQRIALVKVRGSQDVLQLSEGQQANGWTVLQISPGDVIFESNDKTETIELIDINPAPTRRPSARERRSQPPQQKPQVQPPQNDPQK
jgi:hypothetical protein